MKFSKTSLVDNSCVFDRVDFQDSFSYSLRALEEGVAQKDRDKIRKALEKIWNNIKFEGEEVKVGFFDIDFDITKNVNLVHRTTGRVISLNMGLCKKAPYNTITPDVYRSYELFVSVLASDLNSIMIDETRSYYNKVHKLTSNNDYINVDELIF